MFEIEEIRRSLASNSNLGSVTRPAPSVKIGLDRSESAEVDSPEPGLIIGPRGQRSLEPEVIGRPGEQGLRVKSNAALENPESSALPDPINGLAAVALVLSGTGSNLNMCFIKRAEREGDPWSGHMAFPGGRASAADPSPRAVAERETEEEVGLILESESFLGELAYLPVRRLGVETGMMLYPFVYYVGEKPAHFELSDEVASAFWIPLEVLWRPDRTRRVEFRFNRELRLYPAIRFGEYDIWGLTHRILIQFSEVIGRPLPSLPSE
ncbi:MAG: NUDIX hydrolase [Blastocatellia bacterium]